RWELPRQGPLEVQLRCTRCQCVVEPEKNLPCAYGPFHCIETKKIPHNYGRFFWDANIKFLIFDECHKYCAWTSLTWILAVPPGGQEIRTLAISVLRRTPRWGLRHLVLSS